MDWSINEELHSQKMRVPGYSRAYPATQNSVYLIPGMQIHLQYYILLIF